MESFHRQYSFSPTPMLLKWFTILALLTISFQVKAASDFEGEFIPFPEVTIHYYDKDVPTLKQHGSTPLVDFFYTAKYSDWRLLSEFLVSDDERDLERLIVGKIGAKGRQLWFGRNHSDLDQWNRLFHRETYLQTTIHRPGIIQFEDEGGVLPAHITGMTLEDNWNLGEKSLNYRFTFGLGPTLKQQHLVPYDLLKPSISSHRLAFSAIVSDQSPEDHFKDRGLFLGHAIISAQSNAITKNIQTVLGAYINYNTSSKLVWRFSAFYVNDDLTLVGGSNKHSSFGYAYLQPEYNINTTWTYYGRLEASTGVGDDIYVQQIPSFISERVLVGTRYQMQNSQVIKLEIARLKQFGERFYAAEVQWSAAIQ